MFAEFNEQLTIIKDKKRKKHKLTADLQEIENQLSYQKSKLAELEVRLIKEGKDVKRLEGYSLMGLFHTILGSKEQQIEKERQEYLAVKLKYDESKEAISTLMQEHAGVKQELEQLDDVEKQYKLILEEKEKLILENNHKDTQRLIVLAEEIADLISDARELQEAIQAGQAVLEESRQMSDYLSSARGWGTWDMIGGGLLTTAIKHSKINEAKDSAQRMQQLLRSFHRELEDIDPNLKTSVNVEIGSFLTFADYFFDGLIVDWVVQSKIVNSQEQAQKLNDNVNDIVNGLESKLEQIKESLVIKTAERKKLIESI